MRIDIYLTNCFGFFSKNKLDKKDKRKVRKNPKIVLNKDFQSSRYLKSIIRHKKKVCISHKNGFSAIVNSKIKCGIDIEELKYRNFQSLSKIFSNAIEASWIGDDCLRFYMVFCAKEAIIKLLNLNFYNLKDINLHNIYNSYCIFTFNNKIIKTIYFIVNNYLICIARKV